MTRMNEYTVPGDEAQLDDSGLPWETVEEFYRQKRSGLVVSLFYMFWSHQDAEDVAQEAFVQAAKNWHTLRAEDAKTVTKWLYQIAARLALNKLRQRKRRREVALDNVVDGTTMHQLVSTCLSPQQAYEIVSTALDLLSDLSPRQREIYFLRHYFGVDVADIAQQLRCATSTVRVHLHRAQETITRAVARHDTSAATPARRSWSGLEYQ